MNNSSSIKITSFSEEFGIFKKIAEKQFDVVNNNCLKLFMLETENKLFNYVELYSYILDNIASYVFDRKKIKEAKANDRKNQKILMEAIDHLKKVDNEKDKGAGAELGEILLYLFLEQDLKAPKLFSKVELKTNTEDYIKGSDAIHLKFRKNDAGKTIVQLVVGESKICDKINGSKGALAQAFESVDKYLTDHKQDYNLLDTHLLNQFVDENEAMEIKSLFLQRPRHKRETIFGIFIGYTSPYIGEQDDNDTFDAKIIEENKNLILSLQQSIIDEIKIHKVSNYQFNFYFLPFHDAPKDRKHLIKLLKKKETQYTERERIDE